jgi:MSHA biogenesis protein MshI
MQRINLYSAESKPRRDYAFLSLRNCIALWVAIVVLGGAVALAQLWHMRHLRADVAVLRTQIQTEQTALTADQARLTGHVPSPALVAELEKLNGEEAAKKELLVELEGINSLEREGYSGILTSLASHKVAGLWLTEIDVADGNVNLSGLTHDADRVPDFIDTLVRDSKFGSRSYSVLTMKMVEGGLLAFDLRSRSDEEKTP